MNTSSLQFDKKELDNFQEYIIDQKYRLYTPFDITNYSFINKQSFNITTSKEIIDYLISTTYKYPTLYNTITRSVQLDIEYDDTKNVLIQNRNEYYYNIQNTRNVKLKNSNFRKIDKDRYVIYTKEYDLEQLQNIQNNFPNISWYQFVDKKLKIVRYVSRHIKNWDVVHPRNIADQFKYRTILTPAQASGYDLILDGVFVPKTIDYLITPSIYNKFLIYENNQNDCLQLYFSKCLPASDYKQLSYYNNLYSTIRDNSNFTVQYSYYTFPIFKTYDKFNFEFNTLNFISKQLDYTANIQIPPTIYNNGNTSIIDLIYNDLDSISPCDEYQNFMYNSGYYTISFDCRMNTYINNNYISNKNMYQLYKNSNINNLTTISVIKTLFINSQIDSNQVFNYCKLILVPYNGIIDSIKYKWRTQQSQFNEIEYFNLFFNPVRRSVSSEIQSIQMSNFNWSDYTSVYDPTADGQYRYFSGSNSRLRSIVSQLSMFDTIGQFCNIMNDNLQLLTFNPEEKTYYKYWYDMIDSYIEPSKTDTSFYKITYYIYKKFNSPTKIGIGLNPPMYKFHRRYSLIQYDQYDKYNMQEYNYNLQMTGDFIITRTSSLTNNTVKMQQIQNFNQNEYYKLSTFYGFEMKNFSIEKADIL